MGDFGLVEKTISYLVMKVFGPRISIDFRSADPRLGSVSSSRNIHTGEITAQAVYVRLQVNNTGGYPADDVEVRIEQVQRWNGTEFENEPDFAVMRLAWSSRINTKPGLQIPSQSSRYCDFGLIVEPGKTVRGRTSGEDQDAIFWFDTDELPAGGMAGLWPGLYRMTVRATASNAKPAAVTLVLNWIGGWGEGIYDLRVES